MEDLKETVRGYGEQALRELVEEGPTTSAVQVGYVDCEKSPDGSGHAKCAVVFARWPSPVQVRVEFVLQEGDGTPEGARRANVDEIKRIFNKQVYGS